MFIVTGKSLTVFFVGLFILAMAIRHFAFSVVIIEGDSMAPTFVEGDLAVVIKRPLMSLLGIELERGDVVLARPAGKKHPMLKRLVAQGGDQIHLDNNFVVLESPHADWQETVVRRAGSMWFSRVQYAGKTFINQIDRERFECLNSEHFVVPDQSVFVMGDNRCNSADSRAFGPILIELVSGRIIYPLRTSTSDLKIK